MTTQRCENCKNWQKGVLSGYCLAAERVIPVTGKGAYFVAERIGEARPRVITSHDFGCELFESLPGSDGPKDSDEHPNSSHEDEIEPDHPTRHPKSCSGSPVRIVTADGRGRIPTGAKLVLVDGRLEKVNSDRLGKQRVHPLTIPLSSELYRELAAHPTKIWTLEDAFTNILWLSPYA